VDPSKFCTKDASRPIKRFGAKCVAPDARQFAPACWHDELDQSQRIGLRLAADLLNVPVDRAQAQMREACFQLLTRQWARQRVVLRMVEHGRTDQVAIAVTASLGGSVAHLGSADEVGAHAAALRTSHRDGDCLEGPPCRIMLDAAFLKNIDAGLSG
jgi:hypothetical protein